VLVVDDDRSIRALIRDVLNGDYEVRTAADDCDAMRAFEHHAERVAAVITDVQMPGIVGRQLVEWLKERAERLPIIMMSGHAGVVPRQPFRRELSREYTTTRSAVTDSALTSADY